MLLFSQHCTSSKKKGKYKFQMDPELVDPRSIKIFPNGNCCKIPQCEFHYSVKVVYQYMREHHFISFIWFSFVGLFLFWGEKVV